MQEAPNLTNSTPPLPITDGVFNVNVPLIDVEDDDLAIISATASNYYTASAGLSDTCCTCEQ
jgi:hypothetical protein